MTREKILDFIKKRGFSTFEKSSWRNDTIYIPTVDELQIIGYPFFVIEGRENLRWSTFEETNEWLEEQEE